MPKNPVSNLLDKPATWSSSTWREKLEELKASLPATEREVARLEAERRDLLVPAAAGDEEAQKGLTHVEERLQAARLELQRVKDTVERAEAGLRAAEEREKEKAYWAGVRQLNGLSKDRAKAAQAVDEAAARLGEALRAYRDVCQEQYTLAVRLGVERRNAYRLRDSTLEEGLAPHLGGLLPGWRISKRGQTLPEVDWVARDVLAKTTKRSVPA